MLPDGGTALTVSFVLAMLYSIYCLNEFLSVFPPLNCTVLLGYCPCFDTLYTTCLVLIQYLSDMTSLGLFLKEHRPLPLPVVAIVLTWCSFVSLKHLSCSLFVILLPAGRWFLGSLCLSLFFSSASNVRIPLGAQS